MTTIHSSECQLESGGLCCSTLDPSLSKSSYKKLDTLLARLTSLGDDEITVISRNVVHIDVCNTLDL